MMAHSPALRWSLFDAHGVSFVSVYKVDRLTRSLADFAKLIETPAQCRFCPRGRRPRAAAAPGACRDVLRVAPLTSRLRRAAEQLARIIRTMAYHSRFGFRQ